MIRHLDDTTLFQLATRGLSGAERRRAEAHLGLCGACRAARAELENVAAAFGRVSAASAPAALRARVLATARRHTLERYDAELAALFDLPLVAIRALARTLAHDEAWLDGPIAGLRVAHATAGPARAGAYAGFVELDGGRPFPRHRHLGEERVLVLAGGMRLDDGRVLHAGEALTSAAGSSHELASLRAGCLAAVLQHAGVAFGEVAKS